MVFPSYIHNIVSSSKYPTKHFVFMEILWYILLNTKIIHKKDSGLQYIILYLKQKFSSPFNAWQNSNSLRRVLISCRVGERCWFRFSCWILLLFFLIFRFPLLKKTDFDFHQKIKKGAKNTEHISGKTCLANVHGHSLLVCFSIQDKHLLHPMLEKV